MADLGRALISKIIHDADLKTAMNGGIRPTWFEDIDHRAAYVWMTEYHGRYGEVPTKSALQTEFPSYKLLQTPEPFDYYVDMFRDQRKRAIITDTLITADEHLKNGKLQDAQNEFSQGLLKIGREVSILTDDNAVKSQQIRYDAYEEARQNVGILRGITTGFPTLDHLTSGWLKEQFLLFGGAPKQCKSYMLMRSAIAAHDAGYRVLFISFEMSNFEQLVRYDAMTCGINSNKLLHGTLNDIDMGKLKKGFRVRKNMEPFIVAGDISATTTISGIAAKIEQYEPDIVFIDGIYLMENEAGLQAGTPAAYTSISRGLKRLAQRTHLPVVGTTQALVGKMDKSGAVTINSLGWTSAWAQDADLILGTERISDTPLVRLRVVAGRNVPPAEISIGVNWDESVFEEVDLAEDDDDDGYDEED